MTCRRRFIRALGVAPLVLAAGRARALEAPTGTVILTVNGKVRLPNAGAVANFDMAMLQAMPQVTFTTKTPWYATARSFSGPLLRDVLAAAGAQGTRLRAVALNDYRVELPFEDARLHDPIVAHRLDGQPMAVRDKGPLFLIYPFDARPELRNPVYFSRSAWQLRTIEVF
jgi:hypothetical protein